MPKQRTHYFSKRTDRLKIAQVAILAEPHLGGIYTAVQHFAAAIRPWADHVWVNFTENESGVSGECVRLRIDSGFLGRRFGRISVAERAKGEAALAGADFVFIHVPYRFHAGWAAAWCRRNKVPYAFVPHGAFDPYVFTYRAWQKRWWVWAVGRRLLKGAEAIIYATSGEASKAAREVGEYPRSIIPFPTSTPDVVKSDAARSAMAAKLNVGAGFKMAFFLGRLHPIKRPSETLAAFLSAGLPDWHFAVAGPDDGVTAEQLKAASAGNPKVHVLGAVFGEEKTRLLEATEGLVLYSQKENLSFVVLEALAHGVPVVVSDELDIAPDIVAQGCGWVVDGRTSVGRLQGFVELASAGDEERRRRGALGRSWVRGEMSASRFEERIRCIVTTALGKHQESR